MLMPLCVIWSMGSQNLSFSVATGKILAGEQHNMNKCVRFKDFKVNRNMGGKERGCRLSFKSARDKIKDNLLTPFPPQELVINTPTMETHITTTTTNIDKIVQV